jgi:hypothetical protein
MVSEKVLGSGHCFVFDLTRHQGDSQGSDQLCASFMLNPNIPPQPSPG